MLSEDQASGTQLIQTLRREPGRGVLIPIARKPEGDKVSPASGITLTVEAGEVHLPAKGSWLATFEHETLAFPTERYDNQVDALSR